MVSNELRGVPKQVLRAQPHPQFLKWYKTFSLNICFYGELLVSMQKSFLFWSSIKISGHEGVHVMLMQKRTFCTPTNVYPMKHVKSKRHANYEEADLVHYEGD